MVSYEFSFSTGVDFKRANMLREKLRVFFDNQATNGGGNRYNENEIQQRFKGGPPDSGKAHLPVVVSPLRRFFSLSPLFHLGFMASVRGCSYVLRPQSHIAITLCTHGTASH